MKCYSLFVQRVYVVLVKLSDLLLNYLMFGQANGKLTLDAISLCMLSILLALAKDKRPTRSMGRKLKVCQLPDLTTKINYFDDFNKGNTCFY